MYGNKFTDPALYQFYNTSDAALQMKVVNQDLVISMNTVFMYNMMLSSLNDPTNRQYYNFLVPSYYPVQNNVNYNQLYSYRLDLFGPSSAAI